MICRINVGLNVNGKETFTPAQVVDALRAEGLTLVSDVRVHQSATEPTVVADVKRAGGWPKVRAAIFAACLPLQQEAIAVRKPDGSGALIGPKARLWGVFDPRYFIA